MEKNINNNHDSQIALIECILFLKGDEGVDLKTLKSFLNLSKNKILKLIDELSIKYKKDLSSGLVIKNYNHNFYRMVTKAKYKTFLEKIIVPYFHFQLSNAAYETLAIIAYKGPISRNKIENIRMVNVSGVIKNLLTKELIKIVGKADDEIGRPYIYEVANNFYKYFNLKDLKELPEIQIDSIELESFYK